jgi:hypothetical protein
VSAVERGDSGRTERLSAATGPPVRDRGRRWGKVDVEPEVPLTLPLVSVGARGAKRVAVGELGSEAAEGEGARVGRLNVDWLALGEGTTDGGGEGGDGG